MKKLILLNVLFLLFISLATKAQETQKPDSLGLPGDNLNLYAVMKIFQESKTLEAFERKLNEEDSRINNLDLNGDDKVDYIKVIDNPNGNVHNIVLQVPINDKENQDVAVFIVDKNDKGEVQIQLIGDEDLYGKDYIVEPNYEETANTEETPNPGYVKQSTERSVDQDGNTTIINNYTTRETASWPIVSFMFDPFYSPWISPWYWSYYPSYWNPWRPWYWHYYYGYHYNWLKYYYRNYRYVRYYRNPYARNYYYGRRSFSAVYVARKQSGDFRKSYSHPEFRKSGIDLYKKEAATRKTNSGKKPALNNKPATKTASGESKSNPPKTKVTERIETKSPTKSNKEKTDSEKPNRIERVETVKPQVKTVPEENKSSAPKSNKEIYNREEPKPDRTIRTERNEPTAPIRQRPSETRPSNSKPSSRKPN